MKNSMFALLMLVGALSLNYTNAQDIRVPKNNEIVEGLYSLDGQIQQGFSTSFYSDARDALKAFKQYLKENYELKLNIRSSMLEGEELIANRISDKTFNLYAEVREDNLIFWMRIGSDQFVSKTEFPNETASLTALVKDFKKKFYEAYVNDEINVAQKDIDQRIKTIAKETKELSASEADLKKNKSLIEKTEKKKIKMEDKLKKLEEEVTQAKAEVTKLKSETEGLKAKIAETEKKVELSKEELKVKQQVRNQLKNQLIEVRGF